jgi:predicted glycogen debranching enzyme
VIEKRVVMPRRRNTTWVIFTLVSSPQPVRIAIEPMMHVRPHEASVETGLGMPSGILVQESGVDIAIDTGVPRIRMTAHGHGLVCTASALDKAEVEFVEEGARGYDTHGSLWNPCRIVLGFDSRGVAALAISTEAGEPVDADPMAAWEAERSRRLGVLDLAGGVTDPFEAELVLAADQFIIVPVGHAAAASPATEADITSRSVIAGYHWFTDWGRDTMIALDGLALRTGRTAEAALILDMFARHIRDGLIPNLFPEGQRLGLYHTADATLWFFEAVHRYQEQTGDRTLVRRHLPALTDIIRHHRAGTLFGIGVDPADGLLRQGAPGYALTWMDAKVDGWVVTPRRGKAVEINALWYNALGLMADWLDEAGDADGAALCRDDAARARVSFNRRFWNPRTGWLHDVVDGEAGDDDACRPNQLLAIALTHPILERGRWPPVVAAVRDKLLTPLGLRTLAPDHPEYRSQYAGDLMSRDAAYHQGTVWPWLLGPYVDALLKTTPPARQEARDVLAAFPAHLGVAGLGSISEIFDADPPHLPRGCIAQAWSVAEVLRAWRITAARSAQPADSSTP